MFFERSSCEKYAGAPVKQGKAQELILNDVHLASINGKLSDSKSTDVATEAEVKRIQAFLKKERKKLIDISMKKANKDSQDALERVPVKKRLQNIIRTISKTKKKMEKLQKNIKLADVYVAASNLQGAWNLFETTQAQQEMAKNENKGKKRRKTTLMPCT